MNFFVYSRPTIEAIIPHDVPHIIVSISTPGDGPAKFKTTDDTLGVLRLWFDDADGAVNWGRNTNNATLMSSEQAKKIVDFVRAHPKAEDFIVHCSAGISRSSATAAAIMKVTTGDDSEIFDNPRFHPNMWVYRRILEAWYADELED